MRENLVDANTKEFIITYGKPHKPASSDTISRWIKDELGIAGINTEVYKPHRRRYASTSKARDFYTHRLIHNIYKCGVANLNSGHKFIKCRVYI